MAEIHHSFEVERFGTRTLSPLEADIVIIEKSERLLKGSYQTAARRCRKSQLTTLGSDREDFRRKLSELHVEIKSPEIVW